MLINKTRTFTTCFLLILLLFVAIEAGQPVVWETSSRAELLKGDARGVSISDTGVIMLAPKLNEVFNTQQTSIWSSAVDGRETSFLVPGMTEAFQSGGDGYRCAVVQLGEWT